MVSSNDFFWLNYTTDLTQAGLAYACRRITLGDITQDDSPITQLRQMIADIGVELATHRYLLQEKIPHRNLQTRLFTDPDRYTLTIGGRRCAIFSTIISKKQQIRLVRAEPECLLDMGALVHEDSIEAQHLNDDDIFIFAFLNSLITNSRRTLFAAVDAGQPTFQIQLLPSPWSKSLGWHSLGALTYQCEDEGQIRLEIGGLDSERKFLTETLILSAESKSQCSKDFFDIHYLGTADLPEGKIQLTSSALKTTHILHPLDWRNIWIYGLEIILTGFITRKEFVLQALPLPAGSYVFQFPQTRLKSLSLPISKLTPISELFNKAKSWNEL